jgi:hypothetical protein
MLGSFLEVLFNDNGGDDGIQIANDDDEPNLEEESGDSEDGDIFNFGDDICNIVTGVNMLSNNTTYISRGGGGTF